MQQINAIQPTEGLPSSDEPQTKWGWVTLIALVCITGGAIGGYYAGEAIAKDLHYTGDAITNGAIIGAVVGGILGWSVSLHIVTLSGLYILPKKEEVMQMPVAIPQTEDDIEDSISNSLIELFKDLPISNLKGKLSILSFRALNELDKIVLLDNNFCMPYEDQFNAEDQIDQMPSGSLRLYWSSNTNKSNYMAFILKVKNNAGHDILYKMDASVSSHQIIRYALQKIFDNKLDYSQKFSHDPQRLNKIFKETCETFSIDSETCEQFPPEIIRLFTRCEGDTAALDFFALTGFDPFDRVTEPILRDGTVDETLEAGNFSIIIENYQNLQFYHLIAKTNNGKNLCFVALIKEELDLLLPILKRDFSLLENNNE